MLPYFRRYSIYVCIIAIALPVIASTVWPLVTGQLMAASLGGLVAMFALFVLGLFIGYAIFGKRADAEAEKLLAKYNDDCDPKALVDEGAKLASSIQFPCDQSGSWFMTYYAQALLDLGETDKAKEVLSGLRASLLAAKKPAPKVGILANILPLEEKSEGPAAAQALVQEGIRLCGEVPGNGAAQFRDFFESQQKVLEAELSGGPADVAKLSASIVGNDRYPMRIRVEYAWREASAQYKLGDLAKEKDSLDFVVHHGGKLALVQKASERLSTLR